MSLPSPLLSSANRLIIPTPRNDFNHVVLILHTHSDNTTGDLFYTSKADQGGMPLSTDIAGVSLISKAPHSKLTDEI